MKKQLFNISTALCVILLLAVSSGTLLHAAAVTPGNQRDVIVQLRLYEGFKQKEKINAVVVSAYFLEKLPGEQIHSELQIEKEKTSLAKIYNLLNVENLSVMDIILEKGKENSGEIILGGRRLVIRLALYPGSSDRFQIRVREKGKQQALLETDVIIPEEKTAVLGFEDADKRIFFFSFHRKKDTGGEIVTKRVAYIELPRLIKSITPVYPAAAQEQGIEGDVIIHAVIDAQGRVSGARVTGSVHPLLDQAAIDAVTEWLYKPMITSGIPRPMEISFKLSFKLKEVTPGEKQDKQ